MLVVKLFSWHPYNFVQSQRYGYLNEITCEKLYQFSMAENQMQVTLPCVVGEHHAQQRQKSRIKSEQMLDEMNSGFSENEIFLQE